MVSAAAVVDVAVVAAVAVAIVVVVVVVDDDALAAAPYKVNDDVASIAIATTIAARVAPSSKPHKNAATLKILLAIVVVSLYRLSINRASEAQAAIAIKQQQQHQRERDRDR